MVPEVTCEFATSETLLVNLLILSDSYIFLILEVISLSCSVYFLSAAVWALMAAILAWIDPPTALDIYGVAST
jgi:hypothetical protein